MDLPKVREHLSSVIRKLPQYMQEQVIISGGCIASLLRDEEVQDYDIFFKEKSYIYDFIIKFANKNNLEVKYENGFPYLARYG